MIPSAAYEIQIGSLDVRHALRIETHSGLFIPVDSAVIELDNATGHTEDVVHGAPVTIVMGYQGGAGVSVFVGSVARVARGRAIRIRCEDPAARLQSTVTRTWRNCTPHDIGSDVAATAGLLVDLPTVEPDRRSHWVASGQSGLSLLRSVARAWSLDWVLFHDAGPNRLWWGPWNASPRFRDVASEVLSAPDDFVTWSPGVEAASGSFVSWARPTLQHSTLLLVKDAAFGSAPLLIRCDRVQHTLDAGGNGQPGYRTEVEWTRLA
ncbi:MAG: hypothetical protein IV100_12625 [Myxococcales bacterium]|uniref:hypothetical protein n=1 Tax=Sediminibacterium sp. TaxID=1917865 RepID=UPI001E0B2AAB|nr:hypothetical protein [Sediminibacterium sp.]MBT9485843.1 hypothetical protein [Sediminibacterium sp.]MBT9556871.1 hypothetical protein [Myxococcales bacterium]